MEILVGRLKQLLKEDYDIKQGDITDGFDATDISQVKEFLDGVDAVISAGPFAVNKNIAQVASEESIGYFDLTEDVETTDFVKSLKSNNIIMPKWTSAWRYKYMCSWNDGRV